MVSNFTARTYEEKLKEAGMITLEQRRQRGDMIQVYKIMIKKGNFDPEIWFHSLEDHRGEGIRTRYSDGLYNVRQKASNNEVRRNFFSQRICHSWNALPDHVKASTSVNMFKNQYDILFHP